MALKKKIIIIKKKVKTEKEKPKAEKLSPLKIPIEKLTPDQVKLEIPAALKVAKYIPEEKRKKNIEFEKKISLKKKSEPAKKEIILPKEINISDGITIGELAKKMNVKASELIRKMMQMGEMVTINQSIDSDTASIVSSEYGIKVKVVSLYDETIIKEEPDRDEDLVTRPPIVTVMGHVDHGKTMLLDSIRNTNVIATESGGITQHIGAYKVRIKNKDIVFIDTPGHEAFTLMRSRGAQVTDIVVLVVAADDGVMPQTVEAIDHAKEAGVPIIVAINKIDLPTKNVAKIKHELMKYELVSEELGGKTIYVEVSAKEKKGIEKLLEMIALESEMLELKANPNRLAKGIVLESRIDEGLGPVTTVIIQNGTLKIGDVCVAGIYYGKIRALINDRGERVEKAMPSEPIEFLGISNIPSTGDPFQAVESEKYARYISDKRKELKRYEATKKVSKVTLENLYSKIEEGLIKELKVILKGDVIGSVEAIKDSFLKLDNPKVKIQVIHAAAGVISEDDIRLASASNAIVIGFKTKPNQKTAELAKEEAIEIRVYDIIFNVIDDIKKAMEGLLEPIKEEEICGKAEIREVFKIGKEGYVAGCMITEGKINRNNYIRVFRGSEKIFDGKISSLKRFKEDVKEVSEGMECGIGVENFSDIEKGDQLVIYTIKETAQKIF